MKDELTSKQFYLTPNHPCSYLSGREARTLFLDPRDTVDAASYAALTSVGFRRSGSHLYRPHCDGCKACVPVRVPVEQFRWKRRFRRVLEKNSDIEVFWEPAQFTPRHFHLYARYIGDRHGDGDMYPPTPDQFRSFLLSSWSDTAFMSLYLDAQLVCSAVTDQLDDGLSAIYTYFDPRLDNRSLGVLAVLKQLEYCLENNLSYLYLGYWIRDAAKMRYKTDYRPIELFLNTRWIPMN